jgi:hypothetical protein
VTRIALHAVAPEDDERFLAATRAPAGTLYRALLSDVAFRFAELAPGAPGDHELVREHGTPDTAGGVVRIELLAVPADGEARLLAGWDEARAVLARRRGYLGARLYRSGADRDLRFVDVARWSSPLMVARMLRGPEPVALPFATQAAIYQPVAR